jgi:pyrroloquinoline quinone (PQQ) biosynthesis protein C
VFGRGRYLPDPNAVLVEFVTSALPRCTLSGVTPAPRSPLAPFAPLAPLAPLARTLTARLLGVMDRKHHWAYPTLTRPGLSRPQLLVHFRHEYLVYVRDFPVLVAAALAQVPPIADVRRALAENIYEEQTGGLSKTAPHPELFLRMMEGLGLAREDLSNEAELHDAGLAYRELLRESARKGPWQAAVALLTIFVEGSVNERAELEGTYVRARGEEAVAKHALVVHYGCPPVAMDLTRAHAAVEGGHRADAWRMVLAHVEDDGPVARAVEETCERALEGWQAYRDGVAERMGLKRSG